MADANNRHPHVPHSLSYTQHASKHEAASVLPGDVASEPDTPVLPTLASLSDTVDQVPVSHLAYGVLPGGGLLTLPMAAGFHSLFHGDTRSGKSNSIDSLLVQLHHKANHYPLRIQAGDFKRELAATWQRSPLIESIETDPQAIAELIDDLVNGHDGILARYDLFGRVAEQHNAVVRNIIDYRKTTGHAPRLVFLVVDELNAVLEAAGKKSNLESSLKQALQTGAGAGVYILGGAQYLTSRLFGREGSRQFVTRAHFGRADAPALRMMFGQSIDDQAKALLTGEPGRGLIRTVRQPDPTPFQALHCSDTDILDVLALTDTAPTMARLVPEPETLKQPVSAPETDETSFTHTPELAHIVHRLRETGTGKKEIIRLVWNAKPGASAAYKSASAAYDQIINKEVGR
jgi:DNA segregation ATPase FtsK/SpoIIIE-like protein